jgi:hypothetical protein
MPWHRAFLWKFERELQVYNGNVTLPYWNWAYDSQDPLKSEIFQLQFLGLRSPREGDCAWLVKHPTVHCLKRAYNETNFGSFYSWPALLNLLEWNARFSTFSSALEGVPHGNVHVLIGGNGGDMSTMHSPNDPIFWLHHAFIDKLWADRQTKRDFRCSFDGSIAGEMVHFHDTMNPFNMTVQDVFLTSNLCYEYAEFSRNKQLPVAINGTRGAKLRSARKVPPIPESWVSLMRLDLQTVRKVEEKLENAAIPMGGEPDGPELPLPDNSDKRSVSGVIQATINGLAVSVLLILLWIG